jgi:broad specificity phosphatase PhoE
LRAKDTALPFAKKHPAAPMETWEIEEFTYIDPKLYTEKDTDERIRIYKEYWQEADVHHRMADTTESFSMLIGRVKKFLEKLESREEQEIVVFSHGRFIHTLQLYIQKVKELGHENLTDEDLQHIKDTHRELAVFSKSLFPVDNVSIYTIQL